MSECNNISSTHSPIIVAEDQNAMRIYCTECHNQFVIRKEPFKGVPENRQYSKIFKRDVLQGNDNLFYKYNSQFIRI